MKDYYKILGIPTDASPDAIHRAYKKAVKKYHPDVAETGSHERFLEIREAYETLSNPQKRKEYDRKRNIAYYNSLRRDNLGKVRQLEPTQVLRAELILTPEEAYRGGVFTVEIPWVVPCPLCSGDWRLSWGCINCNGFGYVNVRAEVEIKVPPRVLPGMVIIKKCIGPHGREVRLELVCRIRRPSGFYRCMLW